MCSRLNSSEQMESSDAQSKEKTTEIKRVVVMGIIIKGADGLGGISVAGGLFLD